MCSPCLCTLSANASIHLPIPTFGRFLFFNFNFLIITVLQSTYSEEVGHAINYWTGLICRYFYANCCSSTLLTLYKMLIRPLLECGSVIWDPIPPTLISSIESRSTQHHALKLVSKSLSTDYSFLLSQFCLSTLESRRKIAKVTLIFKLKFNLMHSPNSPLRSPPPPQYSLKHYDPHNYLPIICKILFHSTQQPSNYGTLFLLLSNPWLHLPFSNPR